jgi:hypothetical protein
MPRKLRLIFQCLLCIQKYYVPGGTWKMQYETVKVNDIET